MHNSSHMNMAEQNDLDLGFSYSYFKQSEILDFLVLPLGCIE